MRLFHRAAAATAEQKKLAPTPFPGLFALLDLPMVNNHHHHHEA
jgi:hypothetical protein